MEGEPAPLHRHSEPVTMIERTITLDQPDELDALLSSEGTRHLSDRGIDQNVVFTRGRTPLGLAVELGHVGCVRVLLSHGACVDATLGFRGLLTPLHVMASSDRLSAVFSDELLAATGALNVCNDIFATPLHAAASSRAVLATQGLLAAGADVHAVDWTGSTPLHHAAAYATLELVTAMLARCADADARNDHGNTPLLEAAFAMQHAMTELTGVEWVLWNRLCKTVERAQIAVLLIANGADVDARNIDGDTAIFGAVSNGFEGVVEVLLSEGVDVKTPNGRGETMLHVAARTGIVSLEIWEALLKAGAEVAARDFDGRTCLERWLLRTSRGTNLANEERITALLAGTQLAG